MNRIHSKDNIATLDIYKDKELSRPPSKNVVSRVASSQNFTPLANTEKFFDEFRSNQSEIKKTKK